MQPPGSGSSPETARRTVVGSTNLCCMEIFLLPSNIPALKYNMDAAALNNSNGDQGGDSGNLGKGKKTSLGHS